MVVIDKNYKTLLEKILQEGYTYEDPNRKGVKRLEIPSYTFRHSFSDGFPAISLKKLAWKSVVTELIWFLRGDTNIKYLVDNGCNIWNKDAYNYHCKNNDIIPKDINEFIKCVKDENNFYKNKLGDLGKVYGYYWRNYDGFDQIKDIIDKMINTPMSSEIIVTSRNPNDKDSQALPCCHFNWNIVMRPLTLEERFGKSYFNNLLDEYSEEELDLLADEDNYPKYGFELHWQQRSVDTFLGLPFNIASYALLALILGKITGHKALGIQGDLKKVHLYDNSIEAAKELITRECSEEKVRLHFAGEEVNQLIDKVVSGERTLDQWLSKITPRNFKLINYNPQEPLKVEMLSRD